MKASIPSPAAPASVRDEMVRAHLRELLASPIFAGAERLRRLLEYLVQSRLEGREAEVKEYTLGLEVFDRRPDYDTRTDSTVRVHVGKLRDRLRQYYLTEGSASPVRIELPRGSYVPDFVFVTPSDVRTQARPRASLRPWILGGIAGLAIGAAVVASIPFFQPPAPAHFQQLTFRRGAVSAARFAPDGSIVYSAAWEGNPNQLFIARPQEPDSRSFGAPPGTRLLAISRSGQIAVALHIANYLAPVVGTLALTNLSGVPPREILEDVSEADWSPSGEKLAVVHWVGRKTRVEYPVGHVLYEAAAPVWLSDVRISPSGDRIAYLEHRAEIGDDEGWVCVMDLQGRRRDLSGRWTSVSGLAWAPSGRELWFTAASSGMNNTPRAVTLEGKSRVLADLPGRFIMLDAARDGRALVARDLTRLRLVAGERGQAAQQELSWFDGSFFRGIFNDGSKILFDEEGEAGRVAAGIYLRRTDGSPPVRLGDGWAIALSPDEKWVLGRWRHANPHRLVILPVEAGEPQQLDTPGFDFEEIGAWFPDNRHFMIVGRQGNRPARCYRIDRLGGAPEAITPEGLVGPLLSPDGANVLLRQPTGAWTLWPVGGGAPHSVSWLQPQDVPVRWSADGKYFFARRAEPVPHFERITIATGEREQWLDLRAGESTGAAQFFLAGLTGDGSHYAYCFLRMVSDLFEVDNLR